MISMRILRTILILVSLLLGCDFPTATRSDGDIQDTANWTDLRTPYSRPPPDKPLLLYSDEVDAIPEMNDKNTPNAPMHESDVSNDEEVWVER